jgi:hypothetical protein
MDNAACQPVSGGLIRHVNIVVPVLCVIITDVTYLAS